MTYGRASDLIDLAAYVSAHRLGVTYEMVERRFSVDHCRAQRLIARLREVFPDLQEKVGEGQRKVFLLRRASLRDMAGVTAGQLAALDQAIAALDNSGWDTAQLMRLRDMVGAVIPTSDARRIEPDLDLLLESQGFVARPGPRQAIAPRTQDVVVEAILAGCVVSFLYVSGREAAPSPRLVEPYGVLSGPRRYLVGGPTDAPGTVRKYRLDKIQGLKATGIRFERPAGFDLHAYAARGFGAFVSDHEHGEVVWRFSPEAAERAREWVFHPDQQIRDEEDGSLLVSFHASGHVEMCWHLYAWGDKVEVLAPDALRRLVADHRRSDFDALP